MQKLSRDVESEAVAADSLQKLPTCTDEINAAKVVVAQVQDAQPFRLQISNERIKAHSSCGRQRSVRAQVRARGVCEGGMDSAQAAGMEARR